MPPPMEALHDNSFLVIRGLNSTPYPATGSATHGTGSRGPADISAKDKPYAYADKSADTSAHNSTGNPALCPCDALLCQQAALCEVLLVVRTRLVHDGGIVCYPAT